MKNILNPILFYCTSFVAAVSSALLLFWTLQAVFVGLSVYDPKHFKEVGWNYNETLILSEKAFASGFFQRSIENNIERDPAEIKEKARIARQEILPKLLHNQASQKWKDISKWSFIALCVALTSFGLSRFFGHMISRSHPEFVGKKKVIHDMLAIIVMLYASAQLGMWGYHFIDRYWEKESSFTESELERAVSDTIKKMEKIRTTPHVTRRDLQRFNDAASEIVSTDFKKIRHNAVNFLNAELLALHDQNWSLSKLHAILTPLITYMESSDWSRFIEFAKQKKDCCVGWDSSKFLTMLKKAIKFYAQNDFYTHNQIPVLTKEHNQRVQSLNYFISATVAFLLGGGLLFFGRKRKEEGQPV